MKLKSLVFVLLMSIKCFHPVTPQTVALDSSCPHDYIKTNTVTCVCKIIQNANDGWPTWYDDRGEEVSTVTQGKLIVRRPAVPTSGKRFECKAKLTNGHGPNVVYFQPKFAFSPVVTFYQAKKRPNILKINANSTAEFECEAKADPLPTMVVKGQRSNNVVALKPKTGQRYGTQRGIGSKLMNCIDTDMYACVATNKFGRESKIVSVYVRCRPELDPIQNYSRDTFSPTNKSSLDIRIPIIGYPTPIKFALTRVGTEGGKHVAHDYNVTLEGIHPPQCVVHLSMSDLTEKDHGYYVLSIYNGIGDGLNYLFHVSMEKKNKSPGGFRNTDHALLIGLVGFVVAYAACYMTWRREKTKQDEDARESAEPTPGLPLHN